MPHRLFGKDGPRRLYRVTYAPDVAQLPPWQYQFGTNRWDSPVIGEVLKRLSEAPGAPPEDELRTRFIEMMERAQARGSAALPPPYRVLYTAASRVSAYIEVLQDFRPSHKLDDRRTLAAIRAIEQDDPAIPTVSGPHTGIVPADHFERMWVGEVGVDARPYAHISNIESVHYVREQLLDLARSLGYKDVDQGLILGAERAFTQQVSALVFAAEDRFAGITHFSALGEPHENWALFETVDEAEHGLRSRFETTHSDKIQIDDQDLQRAAELLGIEIEGVTSEIGKIVEEQRERAPEREPEPEGLDR